MALAIFDLDETLLSGDSDHAWGEYMVDKALVDPESYRLQNDRFYRDYKQGTLDIMAYLEFVLKPLSGMTREDLEPLQHEYLRLKVEPMIAPGALQLLQQHRGKGDTLLIITATNDLITSPIAKRMDVPHLLASEAEVVDGRVTGKVAGTPSFREGKVRRLEAWMREKGLEKQERWFYSDSSNDLPLLEFVGHPVVVDPDPGLKRVAQQRGWKTISLR